MRLVDYKCSFNMIGQNVKYCSLILANTSNLLMPYFGIGQWHTQVIENPNWTNGTVSFIFKDDKDFKVFKKMPKQFLQKQSPANSLFFFYYYYFFKKIV